MKGIYQIINVSTLFKSSKPYGFLVAWSLVLFIEWNLKHLVYITINEYQTVPTILHSSILTKLEDWSFERHYFCDEFLPHAKEAQWCTVAYWTHLISKGKIWCPNKPTINSELVTVILVSKFDAYNVSFIW